MLSIGVLLRIRILLFAGILLGGGILLGVRVKRHQPDVLRLNRAGR